MKDIPVETIVLDDGIEYIIVEEEKINDIVYTLFANINDETDICFRKTITENGEDFYVGLDDEKEFDLIVMYFTKYNLKQIR